jgi:hypothetical protein
MGWCEAMTKITIDIDKLYNDKNKQDAQLRVLSIGNSDWRGIDLRRSAHDRVHVDVEFPDDMSERIFEELDYSDIEDMYFILFRLAAGDDIRRLRTDAKKFFKGEDIFHWLPSKDDYRKVAEREK